MISNSTVIAFIIAVICTLFVPAVLLIVLGIKKKISAIPLLLGAAAFFLSQIVLRIPLLNVISGQSWYQAFAAQHSIILIVCLSLSAAVFEESARLGGALLLKKQRSYKDAISFGLGHAFCELIILIGLSHLNNVIMCLAVNNNLGPLATMSAELLDTAAAQLAAINPAHIYWGIIERVSAVVLHISATVLVFQGVIKKKKYYYFLAILLHTFVNAVLILLTSLIGIAVSEILMLIMISAAGFFIIKRKGIFEEPAA